MMMGSSTVVFSNAPSVVWEGAREIMERMLREQVGNLAEITYEDAGECTSRECAGEDGKRWEPHHHLLATAEVDGP